MSLNPTKFPHTYPSHRGGEVVGGRKGKFNEIGTVSTCYGTQSLLAR